MLNHSECIIISVLIALLMIASIGSFKTMLDVPADRMALRSTR